MSHVTMPKVELSAGDIISNGIGIGMKNFLNLVLTYLAFVFTIWIPYLNVGTIIAINDLIPKMSRGESISPGYIFDAKYRKNFGEFFLLYGLYSVGIYAAMLFFLVPGIVLYLAWMFALALFVDRDTDPLASLRLSNTLTYGNKLPIFLALVVVWAGLIILNLIFSAIDSSILMILFVIIAILVVPVMLGMMAYVYGKLTSAYDSGGASSGAEAVNPGPAM